MNNYALLQDLLPVLQKHGFDLEGDVHVDVRHLQPGILDRRKSSRRVVVEVRGWLR